MLEAKRAEYVELVPDDVLVETSDERFDRIAFAQRALALLRPSRLTVAVCQGVARIRVHAGRQWNVPRAADASSAAGEPAAAPRWAILSVPPKASRRAIALAVAGLGAGPASPYVLDVLLSEHGLAPTA